MNSMTGAQKIYLTQLMRTHEYDMRTCNLFHRRLAEQAQAPLPRCGQQIDEWLSMLSVGSAQNLITLLREEA